MSDTKYAREGILLVMSSEDPQMSRAMKVTTVRFGHDLWVLLDGEAARAGVSVSQYLREAALARAAFAAGTRAGAPSELLAAWGEAMLAGPPPAVDHATERLIGALTRIQSGQHREEAAALRAESRQARRKSGEVLAARMSAEDPAVPER